VVGKKTEPKRESRIIDEIIVDAYTADERAMSWYYYLESELRFPFEAECIKQWPISPLRKVRRSELPAWHLLGTVSIRSWSGEDGDVAHWAFRSRN
jgi:hypothetical protein